MSKFFIAFSLMICMFAVAADPVYPGVTATQQQLESYIAAAEAAGIKPESDRNLGYAKAELQLIKQTFKTYSEFKTATANMDGVKYRYGVFHDVFIPELFADMKTDKARKGPALYVHYITMSTYFTKLNMTPDDVYADIKPMIMQEPDLLIMLDNAKSVLALLPKLVSTKDTEVAPFLKFMNRYFSAKLVQPNGQEKYEKIVSEIRTLLTTY